MKFDLDNPRTLATTAVMTALVLGLTLVRIAVTPINGYVHLGDIAIFFTSFAFGPWAGLVAGGLGTGLADVVSGYAIFAPLSLVVHGLQGLVAGWIVRRRPTSAGLVLGVLAGGVILVAGYFIGEAVVPVFGGPALALSEVPFNAVQAAFGSLGAVVYAAVARAYPRLRQTGTQSPPL
ncbi:MAG TPA: ECF transporter S component [Chloroflexi bacterium]|nr:ECF transporter S component [Chloroflexota bacterium]